MSFLKTTNSFEKNLKKCQKRDRDRSKLEYMVRTAIANKESLPPKYRNHKLIGNYKDLSECHIEPDWFLIYQIKNNTLYLLVTGSYAELFR
jgi:mRNA interferase YafQ